MLKLIFACGREPSYGRNKTVLTALQACFDVISITDTQPGSLTLRICRLLPRLFQALRHPHDLVYLGFYAHPLVLFARRLTSAPIIFDAFVSTYDTLCFDRRQFSPASMPGRLAFELDRAASLSATRVVLDRKSVV
jgi:hypothetical protein